MKTRKEIEKEIPGIIDLINRLTAHHEWVESNGLKGMRGKFINTDLTGKSWLAGVLDHAYLQGADFRHGYFGCRADKGEGVSLRSADLQFANLSGLSVHDSNCDNADFRCAIVRGTDFIKGTLKDANFRGADLTGATFKGVDLSLTDFRGANLTGVIFIECGNLEHALFDDDYVVKR